jgi:RNA polymerase sigma-70 factor (ECF subfamily)
MARPEDAADKLSQTLVAHREAISRYILGIVRDPAAAEDLTQETLLRAHQKLTTLDDPARVVPWLYRIATNLARDRFRSSSYRNPPGSLESDPDAGQSGEEALAAAAPRLDKVMEQKEMSTCVQDYLMALSDSYRAVILLHDAEGLTNPEIAEMLGDSLATVKIRLHRARAKLREALSRACSFSTDQRGVLVCEPAPPEVED